MKIVFMGTPEYATKILSKLLPVYEIPLVFTQPDKPVGRKAVLTPPDVKKFLLENDFKGEIIQPKTLKDSQIWEKIKSVKPDMIIVAAYGQILPKEILQICFCMNLHASILPKYRGASPIQSAILNGEKFSGVTAMKMEVGLDDGAMLGFSYLDISSLNSGEVFDKMGEIAANLTIKVLENFDEIKMIEQDHEKATKCTKIKKEDGLVNFSDDIFEIYNKFRAFNPWPGIFLQNGIKLIDLKIHPNLDKKDEFGIITKITKDGFCLSVNGGEIEILKIQEPSKKALNALDFINGKRLSVGDKIS